MPDEEEPLICPMCASEFENGFVSYCSGTVWHHKKPSGLGRVFWSAFRTGTRVFGSIASYPYVSSVSAARCPRCSSVVVMGNQQ